MSRHMMVGAALLFLASVVGVAWYPAPVIARAEDKPAFARLIGTHTLVFAHARVGDILKMPIVRSVLEKMPEEEGRMNQKIRELLGLTLQDIESITVYLDQPAFENGQPKEPRPPYMMVRANKAMNAGAVVEALGKETTKLQFGKYEMMANADRGIAVLDERTLVMFTFNFRNSREAAPKELLLYFTHLDTDAETPAGMQSSVALAKEGKHHAVVGFALTKELTAFAEQMSKELPPTAAPFKPLLKVQSGAVILDYLSGEQEDFRVQLRGKFEDEALAKGGSAAVRFAVAMAKMALSSLPNRNDPEMKAVFDFASKQLESVKIDLAGTEVVVQYQMQSSVLTAMLLPAVEKVRTAAARMTSANNMRQCLIAMHNYHADNNQMPEAMTMKNGKPMHSWRVLMLPYLEQDNLFKQIKLDEPWDSESNKKVFESVPMPKVYAHPGKKDEATKMTYYKVFCSKADMKPNAGFKLGSKLTLGQMTVQDGTSNTIAMIEAGPPVLWYKPDDIEFDSKAQLPNLVSPWKEKRVYVAFFDGSVRQLWLDGDEETWKGLITVNGGETVDISKVEEKKK